MDYGPWTAFQLFPIGIRAPIGYTVHDSEPLPLPGIVPVRVGR
jgi:hypothetical protein